MKNWVLARATGLRQDWGSGLENVVFLLDRQAWTEAMTVEKTQVQRF